MVVNNRLIMHLKEGKSLTIDNISRFTRSEIVDTLVSCRKLIGILANEDEQSQEATDIATAELYVNILNEPHSGLLTTEHIISTIFRGNIKGLDFRVAMSFFRQYFVWMAFIAHFAQNPFASNISSFTREHIIKNYRNNEGIINEGALEMGEIIDLILTTIDEACWLKDTLRSHLDVLERGAAPATIPVTEECPQQIPLPGHGSYLGNDVPF